MDYNNELKEPLIQAGVLPLHRQLRLKRLYENMTMQELAERLGFSASLLSYYETGKVRISKRNIKRVKQYVYEESRINNTSKREDNVE